MREPEVFLFDEPLSNLDAELRVATRLEIAKLHQRARRPTMIYVTHDQVEAMTLADRIVVLRDGRVEQVGTPMELYDDPANLFVAGFIGSPKMNFIESGWRGRTPEGHRLALSGPGAERVATLGVRADALTRAQQGEGAITGEVTVLERLGDADFVHFRTPWDQELVARFDHASGVRVGEKVEFALGGKVHFFDADGNVLRDVTVGSASETASPV